MHLPAANAVWIYGPPGVGKSTTGWVLFDQFARGGLDSAYVDIDQLGMCYPPQDSDPDRNHVKARNVGRVLRNFQAAGAERCVVSGVLDPNAFSIYRDQLRGFDVDFFRLTVGHGELRRRNLERGGRDQEDVEQAIREAIDLDSSDLGHPTINTEATTPEQVSHRIASEVDSPLAAPVSADGPSADCRSSALYEIDPAKASGRVIFISGATGVGKSAVAWELFARLRSAGHTASFVDLAQIGFLRSDRLGVTDHLRLRTANLASLWDTFVAAGADHMVVHGLIGSQDEVESYKTGLPQADITLCRLTAEEPILRQRVFERRHGGPAPLAGDNLIGQPDEVLKAAAQNATRMIRELNASAIGDVVVDTTGVSIANAASAIAHEVRLDI